MENKEIKNKRITGETMKLKEKVIGYFQTYWKKNIFTKSVSVLVAACFILNIFNLPAFAEDPLYKKIKDQKTQISVYAEDVDGSVSVAQNRDKIVLVHDGVIYEKKDKKSSGYSEHAELEKRINEGTISESELNNRLKEYNPVGNWNGKEATNVSQMGGVSPQEYKRIIEGKLAASAVTDAASSEDETSVGFFAGTIEKVKDFVTGFNKGSEEDQTKDGSVTDDKVNDGEQKEESVAESKASEKDQKKESVAEDKVSKEESLTELVTKDENATESEEKTEDKYEYDQGMLEDLANKTGKTTDEIEKMLEEARKDSHATDLEQGIEQGTTFDKAMSVLKDFLANGGQVVNCAAEALSTVLNMTNKGLLGFQAILADVSAGLFTKDKIDGDQVLTSASAIKSVMHSYGRTSAEGYGLGLEEFMSGLGEGESGILWVDGDHFITVSKDEEGNFNVIDPNRNNGEAEVYSASEFEKLLSGEEAETVDGKKTEGYQLERDAEGNVLVKTVTDSYGVKEAAGPEGVLTEDEMEQITGAKLVPQTVMVTKTGTKTETRTGTRTETRTGTRTYTDEDGEEHTEEYEYDVEVEYQYEVEVEFTYQEEETVMVEVPDDDEDIEEEQRKEQEEAARAAAIAEQEAKNRELEQKVAEENLRREQEAAEKARETGEGIIEGSEKVIPEEEEEARKEEIEKEAQERESALQQSIEETKEKTEVAQSNNIIKQAELEVVNAKISLDLAKKGEETKEKADIVKSRIIADKFNGCFRSCLRTR